MGVLDAQFAFQLHADGRDHGFTCVLAHAISTGRGPDGHVVPVLCQQWKILQLTGKEIW